MTWSVRTTRMAVFGVGMLSILACGGGLPLPATEPSTPMEACLAMAQKSQELPCGWSKAEADQMYSTTTCTRMVKDVRAGQRSLGRPVTEDQVRDYLWCQAQGMTCQKMPKGEFPGVSASVRKECKSHLMSTK